MRVIVTRVLPQAARWVDWLAQQGHEALALPLIEVAALSDTAELTAVARRWADYAAAMFVSSHAADYFFAAMAAGDGSLPPRQATVTRAWCTGPGTRAALLKHGLAPESVDAPALDAGQFDSEALWQQVHGQIRPGARVLVVRGDTPDAHDADAVSAGSPAGVGRDWLAQRLRQAGAEVDFVVAYQRGAPVWSAAQRALAMAAASDGTVWLFSSAEALGNLRALLPTQDWSRARAVTTHARIAAAARRLGFAVVTESRPTLSAVLASLESLA